MDKKKLIFALIVGIIIGLLVENKLIDTNQEITFYIPEVKNSAFENATIRNLLDMTISTNFKEDYLDKTGIFNLYREATGFNPKTSNNNCLLYTSPSPRDRG